MSARRWLCVMMLLPLYSGCASVGGKASPPLPQLPPERVSGVVFCADGSGGLGGTTHVLQYLVAENRLPLRIEMVPWSHGTGRFLADHFHWRNVEDQAQRLAKQVQSWRVRYPDKPVYFVGQSAGCAVVLEAGAILPPNSVERIVLLAASVSTNYDLKPALVCARGGIDSFHSQYDWFVLGLGMALSGTTDRRLAPAAGRVGFRKIVTKPADEVLYARRLRQHEWESSVSWTGHTGGHYGADCPGHVRACVLPLLMPPGESTVRQTSRYALPTFANRPPPVGRWSADKCPVIAPSRGGPVRCSW